MDEESEGACIDSDGDLHRSFRREEPGHVDHAGQKACQKKQGQYDTGLGPAALISITGRGSHFPGWRNGPGEDAGAGRDREPERRRQSQVIEDMTCEEREHPGKEPPCPGEHQEDVPESSEEQCRDNLCPAGKHQEDVPESSEEQCRDNLCPAGTANPAAGHQEVGRKCKERHQERL